MPGDLSRKYQQNDKPCRPTQNYSLRKILTWVYTVCTDPDQGLICYPHIQHILIPQIYNQTDLFSCSDVRIYMYIVKHHGNSVKIVVPPPF